MKRSIACFFLFIGAPLNGNAQIWEQYYPPGPTGKARSATDIIQTYDKGYLISGYAINPNNQSEFQTWIYKVDTDGKIIWQKAIGAFSDKCLTQTICPTYDNGFFIGGRSYKHDPKAAAFIMKINECGERAWTKEFGIYNSYEFISRIKQTSDGNYVASTDLFGIGGSMERVGLMKFNDSGDTLWMRDYTYGTNATLYDFKETSDKGFLISARTTTTMANGELIKVDSLGNLMWNTYYGIPNYANASSSNVELPDSGYLSLSASGPTGQRIFNYLIRTDSQGDEMWSKFINDTTTDQSEGPRQIHRINDSTAIIICNAYNYSQFPNYTYTAKAIKVDFQGNVIDSAKFGIGNNFIFYSRKNMEGDIMVCGGRYYSSQIGPFAIKINQDLQIDTLLNIPLNYDSLCGSAIPTGFIPYDTASTVGVSVLQPDGVNLAIYPNPSASSFTITYQLPQGNSGHLTIYNLKMQKVLEVQLPKGSTRKQVNLPVNLANGLYQAVITSGGYRAVRKVAVLRVQ